MVTRPFPYSDSYQIPVLLSTVQSPFHLMYDLTSTAMIESLATPIFIEGFNTAGVFLM